jgi:WD40 repeat protein
MLYRAFISYSHASDGKLAPSIQSGLQSFARPWYRLRAMRVFRDKTSLAVNPGLWPSIERALSQSDYFVLLASPTAAASPWVRRELGYWLSQRSPQTLLVVLTDGTLAWDPAAGDFDWSRTDALPSDVARRFVDEPLYLDLRWARAEEQLSMRNARFRDAIADLASTLHARPKDDLVGEDVRRHRGAMRLAWSAVAALTVLTISALVAAYLAVQQRNLANERLRVAVSRQLAVEAMSLDEQHLDLALLLAVEANEQARTAEAATTLKTLLEQVSRLAVFLHEPADSFAFDPQGRVLALGLKDGSIQQIDTATFSPTGPPLRLPPPEQIVLPDSVFRPGPEMRAPGRLWGLAFSPDARSLLMLSPSDYHPPPKTVFQRDLAGEMPSLRRIDRGHFVAISPTGHTVALFGTVAGGHRTMFWNSQQRRFVGPAFPSHDGTPIWLTFHPQGDRMVVAYHNDVIEVWSDLAGSPAVRTWPLQRRVVTSATFSVDGRALYFGTDSGIILQLRLDSGTHAPLSAAGHTGRVIGLYAGPGEDVLTSVGQDGTIMLWNLVDRDAAPRVIDRLPPPVGAVIFNNDGTRLAAFQRLSDEEFGQLRLWARAAPRGAAESAETFSRLFAGAFSGEPLPITPAQTRVANTYDRKPLVQLGGLHWSFHAPPVAFEPTNRLLATALPDDRIALGHLGDRRSLGWRLDGAVTGFTAAALSPDGRLFAWGSADAVNIFDLEEQRRLAPMAVPQRTVTAVAFSGDGQSLAFADHEPKTMRGRLHVVSTATRRPSIPPMDLGVDRADAQRGHGQIVSLAFGPDGRRLVSRNYEGGALIWDLTSGSALSPAHQNSPPVLALAVHPTRPLLAVLPDPDVVQLVDLSSGQSIAGEVFHVPEFVSSLTFHPGGERLTIATEDGEVRSWDLQTHEPVGEALSLPSHATSLSYDADGRHLAVVFATPAGSTVRIWNMERRQTVLPDMAAPGGLWYYITLSRDGRHLAWSTEGRPPLIWETRLESWITRACAMANRDLSEGEWNRYLAGAEYRRTCGRYRIRPRN